MATSLEPPKKWVKSAIYDENLVKIGQVDDVILFAQRFIIRRRI